MRSTYKEKISQKEVNEKDFIASHTPVMVQEVLSFLSPFSGAVFLDTTLGGGGHSKLILDAIQPSGVLVGCDRDRDAIKICIDKFKDYGNAVRIHHSNFSNIKKILKNENIDYVDGIIFDLGFSSIQMDNPKRGFSISSEDFLDMRMDVNSSLKASEIVNKLSENEIADIIFEYGEEKRSRRIAREIVKYRSKKEIITCKELSNIVLKAIKRNSSTFFRKHPATKTFQALRIFVNNELASLKNALSDAVEVLRPGGRIVVISFHSLEDRIVKNYFRSESKKETPLLKILTKKVVRPVNEEVQKNPRARSSRLRASERLGKV